MMKVVQKRGFMEEVEGSDQFWRTVTKSGVFAKASKLAIHRSVVTD